MDANKYVRIGSVYVHFPDLLVGLQEYIETVPAGHLAQADADKLLLLSDIAESRLGFRIETRPLILREN